MKTAKKMPNTTEVNIPSLNKLAEQSFTSREGHLVNFNRTKTGELKANVKVDYLRDPYVDLPVHIERNLDQQKVDVTQLKEWEKNRLIHVQLKGQQISYIYITHEGLMGGGKKKKTKNTKKKPTKEKKKEKEPSNELLLPNPAALSIGKCLPDEEAGSLMERAQKCKEDPAYLQVAINSFLTVATCGKGDMKYKAMYQLGLICEEQDQFELAVRWYVASFEESWWKDPQQAHNSLACQALKRLGYERISLIYPDDITSDNIKNPVLQYEIYTSLIEFYQNGTAEPYLTPEENEKKIIKLSKKRQSIVATEKGEEQVSLYLNELLKIDYLFNKGEATKSEKALLTMLKDFPHRFCLHQLGFLYAKQCKYEEAVRCYKRASKSESFFSLAKLYEDGLTGKINGEIDYQTAVAYYEIAGSPDALHNLGKIYEEGHIDQPDYQKAEEYLKRADTGRSHYALGFLFFKGNIGNNDSHPDYILAAQHFLKATEKGFVNAFNSLGVLCCLNRYSSKDNNQPNYELAVEYFQKVISNNYFDTHGEQDRHRKQALSNLGVVYAQGNYGNKDGKPDYETAKKCFEESALPHALYNIGLLYEQGHLGTMDSGKEEQRINYQKALTYYEASAIPEAQLAILHLYQLDLIITNSPEEKQQAVNKLIEEINDLLPDLPTDKQLYIQGMIQYYMGNWEDALVTLKEAWVQGSQQAELPETIEEVESYYASEVEEEIKLQETPIETEEEFNEKHIKLQQITAWKTLTKAQKKIIQFQRTRQRILDNFKPYSQAPQQLEGPLELEFKDNKAKEAFEAFRVRKENKKVGEILEDLKKNPWGIRGAGKPEVLKGNLSGYMSRRIDQENRLLYKVVGPNKVRVISWEGHYKNVIDF